MHPRTKLLESIGQIIRDYRSGLLPQPVEHHIERWVKQFDSGVQLSILEEINFVLKKTYFSKNKVSSILRSLIHSRKVTGDSGPRFWREVNFLDIQGGGNSQSDLLALFSEQLANELKFGIEDYGKEHTKFIYLDDCIFTGNRLRRDIENWVRYSSPPQAELHVFCVVQHSGCWHYINEKIQECIKTSGKKINFSWWHHIEFEDRLSFMSSSDVLRPTNIPDDPAVQAYVATMQHQPNLRRAGNPGTARLFSSDSAKIILEQEFLKAGVRIRHMCPKLSATQRPLGHMALETLGFGSLIVTYRNCPNNAPLAFWVDAPWYPLFPRATNTQTAVRRLTTDVKGGIVR